MSNSPLELVKKAIIERRCLVVRYGDERGIRLVEPHAAYTSEHGDLVVDCYQTRGHSASGRKPPFWRRLRLKKFTGVSLLEETFEPRFAIGFSVEKQRYKNGLVAIVDDSKPSNDDELSFMYSPEALRDMGPFLPDDLR